MRNRTEILQNLIDYKGDLSNITEALKKFGWDSDKELIQLNRINIILVLERYINSTLTSSDVEEWANIIEGRDDIGYEIGYGDLINSAIHELANPLLIETLSIARAKELINHLSQ